MKEKKFNNEKLSLYITPPDTILKGDPTFPHTSWFLAMSSPIRVLVLNAKIHPNAIIVILTLYQLVVPQDTYHTFLATAFQNSSY